MPSCTFPGTAVLHRHKRSPEKPQPAGTQLQFPGKYQNKQLKQPHVLAGKQRENKKSTLIFETLHVSSLSRFPRHSGEEKLCLGQGVLPLRQVNTTQVTPESPRGPFLEDEEQPKRGTAGQSSAARQSFRGFVSNPRSVGRGELPTHRREAFPAWRHQG